MSGTWLSCPTHLLELLLIRLSSAAIHLGPQGPGFLAVYEISNLTQEKSEPKFVRPCEKIIPFTLLFAFSN